MAEPIKYQLPPPRLESGRQELESLLWTLHESGTLRTLTGLFGSLEGVTGVALDHLQTPGGQRLSNNVAIALMALTKLDMQATERMTQGLIEGVKLAAANAKKRTPGFFRLLVGLHSKEARAGLYAVITILQAVGRELSQGEQEQEPSTAVVPVEGRGDLAIPEPYLAGG
jgi:uncharacterized protein YjgD (DUF1641 family)